MPSPPLHLQLTPHQQLTAAAVSALALAGIVWLRMRRRRPGAADVERTRRARLASLGRITDGNLLDADGLDGPLDSSPEALSFTYKVAGVAYEAVQDVSSLPEQVRKLRVELPVQVRYDPANPADSIVVAEAWTGLRHRSDPSDYSAQRLKTSEPFVPPKPKEFDRA